jgi:hypothetical protein
MRRWAASPAQSFAARPGAHAGTRRQAAGLFLLLGQTGKLCTVTFFNLSFEFQKLFCLEFLAYLLFFI